MFIKEKISQHRRDFTAWMGCEFCDAAPVKLTSGYDDAYYHTTVIPAMACGSCGHAGNERETGPRTTPDVPAGVVV